MSYASCVCLVACGFMAMCGSTAFAADPLSRLEFYQSEFKGRESGVYEADGDLFVHVAIPVGRHDSAQRLKLKAVARANDLLRKWAVDFTRPDRASGQPATAGTGCAIGLLDDANPLWRFSDWNVKLRGQEFCGQDKTVYWFVQIFSKEDVARQIPASFRATAPSRETTASALKTLLPQMLNASPGRVYGKCNAFDLDGGCVGDDAAKREYERVAEALESHLASAEYPVALRRAADSISCRRTSESWVDALVSKTVETNFVESVVTNAFEAPGDFVLKAQFAQTSEDRKSRGVSLGGNVDVESHVCTQEEFVVTRTVTVVETRRNVRVREGNVSYGTPRFQMVFLSGATSENEPAARIPSGDAAVKSYFDGESDVASKERHLHEALSENPGDAELWNMLGRCRLKQDDVLSALVCFRAALKLDGKNQFALTNLAIAYDMLKCPSLASGMAVIARGLAEDGWCVEKSEEILFGR